MKIFFILALLALSVFAAASILQERRYTNLIRLVSCGASVLFSAVGALVLPYLRSLCIGIAVFSALSMALSVLSDRIGKEGYRNFARYMAKAVLLVLLLEAVCFNFNSYHLWKGGYEETALDIQSASVTNMTFDGGGLVFGGDASPEKKTTPSIEFTGVDRKIGVIRLDLVGQLYKTDYTVDFTDETNASYDFRTGYAGGSVFNGIEQTKYVVCDFSGRVGKFRVSFPDWKENSIHLSGITLNADYPSHFSYVRVLLILLCIAFVFAFRRAVSFRRPIGDQADDAKSVTIIVVTVMVCLSMLLTSVNLYLPWELQMTEGNQITQELVDAFESGQVALKETPPKELLDMENPYDLAARDALENGPDEVEILWDHVLYDGKYYSYYGVGPVILLFLPYHLLTGYYLGSMISVLLFNTLALIFLGATFFKLMKALFRDIPLSMYTAALLMIYASCGVWYCTVYADFYEIAQSSAFCFTVMGAYFLVASNVIGDRGPVRPAMAALSSLFLAIAVTCRPTTAVWCAVAVLFIIAGVCRLHKAQSGKKACVKYLVAALLPFVVIGAAQMAYNYARFGSFTDFGIDYSLTINDFTHAEFHTQLAAIGFFNYLLAPPSFSGHFPYVQSTLSTIGVNGFYFMATDNGAGLLYRALPTFFLFGSPFALKYVERGKRVRTAILFGAVAFIAPFAVIASVWESGYGTRYMMDFAWQMLTCAFLVMFLFYRHLRSREAKRIYEHLLLIMMFACLFINMGLVYAYWYPNDAVYGSEAIFERFGRMFSMFNT